MEIKQFIFNPFQENTYVLSNEEKECIVIDPGCLFDEECDRLVDYIRQNGLHLTHILLTHLHLDHIFGCKRLHDEFGVLPEAHKADEFLLELFPAQMKMFGLMEDKETVPLKGHLTAGETIQFGTSEWHVIHTPGHSPGGLCFYSPQERVLFSGDTLFQCSVGRCDLSGGNGHILVQSIKEKLLILPEFTTVYPGHGPETSIEFESANNPFIQA